MLRRSFLPVVAVLALLAACSAEQKPEATLEPTAPGATPRASVSATDSTTSVITTLPEDAPPICHAYLQRRDALKARLLQDPGNEDLTESVTLINGFLNENCR